MRKMKDSGIRFVGNIPSNWKIEKNKHCFEMEKEIVGEESANIQLLSLTKKGIICKDLNSTGGKVPESFDTYQKVKKGQIVLCLFDLDCSAVFSGLSNYDGMISPAYKAYNCRENIHNRYAMYWFDFCFNGRKYMSYSKSLRYVVNADDFKDIEIILPPIEEQIKITNFLDEKVGEIDKIIEKTKGTIEEYKKYKESIITNAVTKGINEKTKDWKSKKIKMFTNMISKGTTPKEMTNSYSQEYCIRYLKSENIINNTMSKEPEFYITKQTNEELNRSILKEDDILFVIAGASIGKTAILDKNLLPCNTNQAVAFLRLKDENKKYKKYIWYFLQSDILKKYIQLLSVQAAQPNLSMENLGNIKISYPNSDIEINNIIEYLDKKCSEIDQLIKNKENLITELEKYKKSLIYEYVTGKKEVKEISIADETKIECKKVNCTDNIFAQAILLCKIIEKLNKYNLGRVKAEKTLYLIEKELGFDFSNNYVREKAGPLAQPIYKCETIISKKNKWVKINKVKQHIEYEILCDFDKYKKYYNNYYSGYDDRIEKVINIIKDCSTDKAEMIATLYASWNDFIIKGENVSDIKIVKDVRENWNDSKKRFNEETWINALSEMKKIGLVPKGYGSLTVIKEQ